MKKKILVILALCFACNALPSWACSASSSPSRHYEFLGWGNEQDASELTHNELPPSLDDRPYAPGADQTENRAKYLNSEGLVSLTGVGFPTLDYFVEDLALVEDAYSSHKIIFTGEEKGFYYNDELIKIADADTVWRMPSYYEGRAPYRLSGYYKDKNNIYFFDKKLAGDVKTAFDLDDGYYLDAQHIYFRGRVLEGALPNAFEKKSALIISDGYVFYMLERLPLDADTLEVLSEFTRDSGLGGGCFDYVYNGNMLKDKNGTYRLHASGILELIPEGESSLDEEDMP